jgi:hypothetical protein
MNAADEDGAWFYELLDRAAWAEAGRDRLVRLVLRDHDDSHPGNARWCIASACRAATDRARRQSTRATGMADRSGRTWPRGCQHSVRPLC